MAAKDDPLMKMLLKAAQEPRTSEMIRRMTIWVKRQNQLHTRATSSFSLSTNGYEETTTTGAADGDAGANRLAIFTFEPALGRKHPLKTTEVAIPLVENFWGRECNGTALD